VTLDPTLVAAEKNLAAVGLAPTSEDPCDLVADKGYHSRDVLKNLDDSLWKTRIAEPRPSKGYLRWHGDDEARAAVYANRKRLRSGVGKEAMRKRGEVAERSFAHVLERGGLRRTWLRGRKNVYKRYLVHISSCNLGILMRALFGAGTPKEAAVIRTVFQFVIQTAEAIPVSKSNNAAACPLMLKGQGDSGPQLGSHLRQQRPCWQLRSAPKHNFKHLKLFFVATTVKKICKLLPRFIR
jgi:transposase